MRWMVMGIVVGCVPPAPKDDPDTTRTTDSATTEPPAPLLPLGIDLVTQRWSEEPEAVEALLQRVEQSGVKIAHMYGATWAEAEPSPGVYDFSPFDTMIEGLAARELAVTVDISTPVALGELGGLPADLSGLNYDAPLLQQRYLAFLDAHMAKLAPLDVTHVVLHTETGSQTIPEGDRDAYCGLLVAAAEHLRQIYGVEVGTYATDYDDDAFLECINRGTDFLGMSLMFDPPTDTPASLRQRFDRIAGAVDVRPVAIIEAGYPSSSVLGSSEAEQVEFVDALFDLVAEESEEIAFASFYTMFDEDRALADTYIRVYFPDWPEELVERYVEWVATLGLQTSEGQPKPSWDRFLQRINSSL